MRDNQAAAHGLLLLDKPTGPTSHDMVNAVRGRLGWQKVGHAGTLDPLASGLLVILVGRATKLAPFIPGDPKVYEGSMLLGLSTDTLDTAGEIVAEAGYRGGMDEARDALLALRGEGEQLPPMYSAAKFEGKPLYRYARRGEEVPRRARKVSVYRVEMTAFRDLAPRAEIDFIIACSPGAYVRGFAAQVGEALGCGAALSRLRRISSGPFQVEAALGLEELLARLEEGAPPLVSLEEAVVGMARVEVKGGWLQAARNGGALSEDMVETGEAELRPGDPLAVMAANGALIGIHEVVGTSPLSTRPIRILPPT